ncbi:hypothetical protein QFZ24_000431 [Streptomyces phaeochromogenes]|nr:hypothetical protein [Streptomyces phaeochromogenes]
MRPSHFPPSPNRSSRPQLDCFRRIGCLIVDRHGTPLAITLTGGNRHDVTQLLPRLDAPTAGPSPPQTPASVRRPGLRLRQVPPPAVEVRHQTRDCPPRRRPRFRAGQGVLGGRADPRLAAPGQTAPHPLRADLHQGLLELACSLDACAACEPRLERSVGYAEPPRPHLVQKRLQGPHCGSQALIRDVKRLWQAQPIPAQPPEVEDFAPVGCEVHIDLSAVVADEAASCPMNRVGVGVDVITPADPARTDQAEDICQSLQRGIATLMASSIAFRAWT